LNALTLSLGLCCAVLVVHFVGGGDVFLTLAKSSGSLILTVWIFIILAHLAMRRKLGAAKDDGSQFKAWFYPYSNWLALAVLLTLFFAQAFNPNSRIQFWITLTIILISIGSYFALRHQPSFGVARSDVEDDLP
jgi:L-asparagine transporter-like permease